MFLFWGVFFLGGQMELFLLGTPAGSLAERTRWLYARADLLRFRPGTPAARVYQVTEVWPYGPVRDGT